ncbi:Coatomer protein complex, gamma sub-unit [Ectocarpus siliculosus]|uniref:AP-1 complex subunit gamma n=1 Tax=Ectocarpus siliculosus TaxID=2880 RepID=D8LGH0_ECTSI|nr:Coatomer protein complex, gamma sub-unit [Ectocarpus siliculosus]|eukprot:CBN75745.1 Coatomer protein complex, gamma sub-unit [Ectocarpus siliculosus]
MSIRLRQLIRKVRSCKTAAEERAVIATEGALIRTAFKEGNDPTRARNVARLLYMHMFGEDGYPSHFGQMECIKLIASPGFPDKRVGYLGLMLLLQEKDEVLMLGTNSLKSDLSHPMPQVVGLALCAVGNLATPDMSRDLAMEVDKHLKPGSSSNMRKKAALCTIRVLKKCPELVEDFIERVVVLLVERSHGVVMCGVQLLIAILEIDEAHAEAVVKVVPSLVRLMRNLLSTGFSSEYDVAGVTDPFLQVQVLRLLRLLGQYSQDASEEVNSVLSQVATTTETAKNSGNAILYECVRTIMKLESESSLRSMAVNILGRFLLHRDNNMRYVALRTLGKVVSQDLASVQRHRGTIVECLKDPDPSIRVRALDLIFQLVSRNNARALVAELLNYLVVAPSDQKRDTCSRILQVLEDHSPSGRWRVDTLLSMLGIAGAECDRSIPSAAVVYVTQNEDLHAHAAHKTFRMIKSDLSQKALTLAGVWFAGEYGDLLLRPCAALPAEEGVEGEEGVDGAADHNSDRTTRGYVLTALTKLAERLGEDQEDAIEGLLQTYSGSMNLELQARSCEFGQLLRPELGELRKGMLDRMPVADEETVRNRRARFRNEDDDDEGRGLPSFRISKASKHRRGGSGSSGSGAAAASARAARAALGAGKKTVQPLAGPAASAGGIISSGAPSRQEQAAAVPNLLDLDDLFGGGPGDSAAAVAAAPGGEGKAATVDLMADIFSAKPAQPPAAAGVVDPFAPTPAPATAANGSGGGVGTTLAAAAAAAAPGREAAPAVTAAATSGQPPPPSFVAFEKGGLTVTFELSKPSPTEDPSTTLVKAIFRHSGARGRRTC